MGAFGDDFFQDARHVLEDLIVPEPQHAPAKLAEVRAPSLIGGARTMLSAIDLYDKLGFKTGKIDDIGRYRVLPAKPQPLHLSLAKRAP